MVLLNNHLYNITNQDTDLNNMTLNLKKCLVALLTLQLKTTLFGIKSKDTLHIVAKI